MSSLGELRVVFFGTPDFAVPTLAALVAADLGPALVVSQPDRPVGRGRRLQAPPVARWASERGLPLHQPEKVRSKDLRTALEAIRPDVAVVVAYGQIFPRSLLGLPRMGCVNLHASLLPRWRGAAPIQAAIAAGDPETGVTTMQMEAGLDTGPILLQRSLSIGPDETTPALADRLSRLGADLMVDTLGRLADGSVQPREQDDTGATLAPRLDRADGDVDWMLDASRIYARWRAFQPWPGLSTHLGGEPLKLVEVAPLPGPGVADAEPGSLLAPVDGLVPVVCGAGTILALRVLQRPGRRAVAASDLFHGERLEAGARVG